MKKEELFEALEGIDENSIREARLYIGKKKKMRRARWVSLAACAAIFLLTLIVVPIVRLGRSKSTAEYESAAVEEIYDTDAAAGEAAMNEEAEKDFQDANAAADFQGTKDAAAADSAGKIPGLIASAGSLPADSLKGVTQTAAVYPSAVAEEMDPQEFTESEEHWKWWEEYLEKIEKSAEYQDSLGSYYQQMMKKILVSDHENTVCSPLNTYMAFALLAEISDGNTRQQILDMLNVPDVESLRARVTALWDSNYVNTPVVTSLLANSLWLKDSAAYNEDTLQRAADLYYASSFRGDPGSEEMSRALSQWTDANTGGLLSEYTESMKLNADTILAIVSTIYYKAAWNDKFDPRNTRSEIFHGVEGDTTVEMMHNTDMMGVYRTDTFTSVGLGLSDSGAMYFYLPEEGVDVNELAKDPDILKATMYGDDDRWSYPMVNLSVPKFRVSGKTDLMDIIRELGITDALDASLADFTPLTEQVDNIYLGSAEHAAMVEVDETGVTGAAYTEMMLTEGAAEPEEVLDFVLDRPFLFVVTGRDGSVLFSGIIRK